MPSSLERLATAKAMCPRCEARPNETCRTISGTRATRPHSARSDLIYVGWRIGYSEGTDNTIETAERKVQRTPTATAEDVIAALRTTRVAR